MAIAFDSSSSNFTSPATSWSHTCTGSNLKLIVAFTTNVSGTDNVTAVAYNGVALTKIAFVQKPSDRGIDLWYLDNPATGTHNITATGTGTFVGYAASYTGCGTGIDSSNSGTVTGATSITTNTTVVAANCWLVGVAGNDSTTNVAGTGTTIRVNDTGNASSFIDSNGTVGTGSQGLQVTWSGSHNGAGIVASIPVFVPIPFKTWNGVAEVDIATINGLS